MRRMLAVFLSLLMVLVMTSTGFAAERSIRVMVDDTELQFDAEPFMANSRTLVPVRALAEKLGFVVGWDEADQRVTLTRGETVIELWIGSTKVMVNGQESQIDVAPTKKNDRTFVPVRFVSEQLGTHVGWDDKNWAVKVSSGHGLLQKLSKQQNQKTDSKGSADLQMSITMSNPAAPGGSVTVNVPMHMDMHLYQNEMLVTMTQDMGALLPGMGELTVQSALKAGVMYVLDPVTQEWQEIGSLDLSGGAAVSEGLGQMDMTQIVKLSESMVKDVSVRVGGVGEVDGVQVVRMDLDLSKISMEQMLDQVAGLAGLPAEAELDIHLDRYLMTAWVNPATGHTPKMEIDMAMTMTVPTEDGSTATMSFTVVGSVLSKQVSEPIAWPEGL